MNQARTEAAKIGFPSLVRPSFVLGGRAMEICYDMAQFERFVAEAFVVAQGQPVLIDQFLEDATEVDVDCLSDGENVIVAGIMEHIEEAGVHSGDSACAIPPYSLPGPVVQEIREATIAMARHLRVVGLMNVQFAVKREDGKPVVYVLEVNPRASRTVPFVAKATGLPVAKVAAKVMAGMTLPELGVAERADPVAREREGERLSVPQVRRRRYRARPRDEEHGRSDGDQRAVQHRLRQEPACRGHRAAARGQDFRQRQQAAQRGGRRSGPAAGGAGHEIVSTEGTAAAAGGRRASASRA